MKQKPNLKYSVIAIVLAGISFSILQSCVKSDDFDFNKVADINWNPNVSVPIVHSALGLDRIMSIVDPGTISIGSDHFVTLVYKGNILSVYGYEYLKLNDPQSLADQNINLTSQEIATLSTYDSVSTQRTANYPFGVTNGEHIDSMTLGSGNLNIHISSVIRHSGVLTVSMPTAKLNGRPFSMDIPFTFNNTIPVYATGSFDLTGYDFDLSSTGSFSVLPVIYTAKFINSGSQTYTSETFTVQSDFSGLRIKKVFGDFGQQPFPIANTDSSRIEIFNNAFGGIAFFDDPRATFTVSNSFGMIIDAHFDSLYAYKARPTPTYTNITGFPNPIPILAPTILGQTADTSFTLDQNNSNIKTVINQGSNYIGYNITAISNPGGGNHNFLEDSSRLKVDVKVELPMYGYADGFFVQDTADFSLQNIKEVEWAKFRLNITNGFPIDAYTQVYFVDSAFTILDSMLAPLQQVIVAGQVDNATGLVNKPTLVTTDEYFSNERLQKVYSAKKLLIRALMNSYQYQTPTKIKIYSDYILDVRIGVQAQLKIKVQ